MVLNSGLKTINQKQSSVLENLHFEGTKQFREFLVRRKVAHHMGRYHETEASMEKTGLKHVPHSVRRATKGHHGVCINGGQLLPDNHPQLREHMLSRENKSISGRPKKSIQI